MKDELLAAIIELRPILLYCLGLSVVAYGASLFFIGKIDLKGNGRIATIFVGLQKKNLVQMVCSWVKCILTISVLASRYVLDIRITAVIAGLILAIILIYPSLYLIGTEIVGSIIIFASLWVEKYLIEYQTIIRKSGGVKAAYWLLAAFVAIASLFILLREVNAISGERNYFDENGETE